MNTIDQAMRRVTLERDRLADDLRATTIERDVLRDALDCARHTIDFLHACLTKDNYSYAYPQPTLAEVASWDEQWPRAPLCLHSFVEPNCPACAQRIVRAARRAEWDTIRKDSPCDTD